MMKPLNAGKKNNTEMNDTSWLETLKKHYTAPMHQSFKQFKLGAMTFFLGMVLLYIAQSYLDDSWQQEWTALAGIILTGIGFLLAMLAQVRILISRIVKFFLDKPEAPQAED